MCVCVHVLANVFIILCMSVRVCVFDINVFFYLFSERALWKRLLLQRTCLWRVFLQPSDIITLVDSRRVPWSMVYDCCRLHYQHVKFVLHFSNTRSDKIPQDNRDRDQVDTVLLSAQSVLV